MRPAVTKAVTGALSEKASLTGCRCRQETRPETRNWHCISGRAKRDRRVCRSSIRTFRAQPTPYCIEHSASYHLPTPTWWEKPTNSTVAFAADCFDLDQTTGGMGITFPLSRGFADLSRVRRAKETFTVLRITSRLSCYLKLILDRPVKFGAMERGRQGLDST
jgi:hypothetical protein